MDRDKGLADLGGLTDLAGLMADHVVRLDGGLSTALEEHGHLLTDSLWTARLLLEAPAEVTAAHAAFVAAGAEVLITASYQVSEQGFMAAGLSAADASNALRASVGAARAAGGALVAASVGPYGAILHDGSEYRGRYGLTVDELVAFHRPRLDVLLSARPDAIAVETIPDLDEAAAVAEVLGALPAGGPPAWIAFSCAADGRLHSGHDVADAAALVAAVSGVVAVGVNCTRPADVAPALERIRSVTELPLVVYPNGGGSWDAEHNCWHDQEFAADDLVAEWLDLGVRLLGGCCGYGPSALAALGSVVAALERS